MKQYHDGKRGEGEGLFGRLVKESSLTWLIGGFIINGSSSIGFTSNLIGAKKNLVSQN